MPTGDRAESGSDRVRLVLLAIGLTSIVGCTTTMRDYFNATPLPPLALHQGMQDKAQCMHCHTAGIAGARLVPHPQYKRCVLCHTTEMAAAH